MNHPAEPTDAGRRCSHCPSPAAPDRKQCEQCLAAASARQIARRKQRLAADPALCVTCSRRPADPDYRTCTKCRERLEQRARRSDGRCNRCSQGRECEPGKKACSVCLEKAHRYRQGRKRDAGSTRPSPKRQSDEDRRLKAELREAEQRRKREQEAEQRRRREQEAAARAAEAAKARYAELRAEEQAWARLRLAGLADYRLLVEAPREPLGPTRFFVADEYRPLLEAVGLRDYFTTSGEAVMKTEYWLRHARGSADADTLAVLESFLVELLHARGDGDWLESTHDDDGGGLYFRRVYRRKDRVTRPAA